MLHRIDKYILRELLTHDSSPFSELRPPGVETNTLTYRLKRFMNEGLVAKNKTGQYYLTSKGQLFTDHLNLGKFVPRELPRPITLIVCRRGDEWLLCERLIHPMKDLVGLPHANLKPGLPIIEAAEQRMKDVMGLSVKLTYRGSGYLTFYKDQEVEGYSQINIVENISQPRGTLNSGPIEGMGRYFWEKAPDFSGAVYIPSMKDIEKAINKQGLFFMEKTYDLKST